MSEPASVFLTYIKDPGFLVFVLNNAFLPLMKSCFSHVDSCKTKTKMLKLSVAEILVVKLAHSIKPEGSRG